MSIEANKKEFMGLIAQWMNKPMAFPPYSSHGTDFPEVPVYLFDWDKFGNQKNKMMDGTEKESFIQDLMGDCESTDFNDICDVTEENSFKLKENWLPFAITMANLNDCKAWADRGFDHGVPQFSELLFVDLNNLKGKDTPIYSLEVDGTAIPKESIPLYSKTIGQLNLQEVGKEK